MSLIGSTATPTNAGWGSTMERAAGMSPPSGFTASSLACRLRAGCPAARSSMHTLSPDVVVIMQDGSSSEAVGHSSSATMDPAREKCQPERIIEPRIIAAINKSLLVIVFKRLSADSWDRFQRPMYCQGTFPASAARGIIPTRASDLRSIVSSADFKRLSALPRHVEPNLYLLASRQG